MVKENYQSLNIRNVKWRKKTTNLSDQATMCLVLLWVCEMMVNGLRPLCARGRLNGPSDLQRQWSEVKYETPFRYAHAAIRTRMVVIFDPTCYQSGHADARYEWGFFLGGGYCFCQPNGNLLISDRVQYKTINCCN